MLKANELRIGNFIKFHNHLETEKVVTVNARFFSSLAGGRSLEEMKPDEELSNYYFGIPLTTDILKKCGFIEKKDWYYKEKFLLGFLTTEDNLQAEWKFGGVDGVWNLINIKYLHQLQNIYHALTGVELKIVW